VIFLIRHGETALNATRVFQPHDTPLSDRGLEQAARLGRRMRELGVARLLSSDMPRALMTAQAIADGTDLEVLQSPLLQERNFGELRGRPYSEVGPIAFAPDFAPPGGETWEVFERRVGEAWGHVLSQRPSAGNLAVVTHGMVCRSLATQFFSLEEGTAAPDRFGNTSLSIVDPDPPHRVSLLACVAHLSGDSADDESAVSGI
jgi:probable phosphoglycerate mutase